MESVFETFFRKVKYWEWNDKTLLVFPVFFCFSQFAFKTQMYIFPILIHSLPTISCHFTVTVNVCLGKVGLLSISIA